MGILDIFKGNSVTDSASPKVKDPQCGMEIDPATAAATYEVDGEKYYFCSETCKSSFVANQTVVEGSSEEKHDGCC